MCVLATRSKAFTLHVVYLFGVLVIFVPLSFFYGRMLRYDYQLIMIDWTDRLIVHKCTALREQWIIP